MMCSRCEAEFETATIVAFGNVSAMKSVSEPHPHPSSRIRWPSSSRARETVSSSIAPSASVSVRVDGV